MRRLLLLLTALALLSPAAGAAASPTVTCANPTHLTGTEGTLHYPPYVVQQDQWTGEGQQTMDVCGPASWVAHVTQSGAPATGVKTYPDSQKTYTDWSSCGSQHRVDSFTAMRSRFAETPPTDATASYDAAYDVFLNGGVCNQPVREIMWWNEYQNISVPTAQANITIGGTNYDVYASPMSAAQRRRYSAVVLAATGRVVPAASAGSSYIQLRRTAQTSKGHVAIRATFRKLERMGLMFPADTMQFTAYGFEVLTTNGATRDFTLTDFAVHDSQ